MAALRRARRLRHAISQLAVALQRGPGIGGCGPCAETPTPACSRLWRLPSPLLRHLHGSAGAQAAAETPPLADLPLPPYQQLQARAAAAESAGGAAVELTAGEHERFHALMRSFESSADVKDQALALYVNAKLYAEATKAFRQFLLAGMDAGLRDALLALHPDPGSQEALFPYFAQFALDRYTKDIRAYREVVKTVDMRQPHQWFPVARSLERRVIYHAGPTNSGKTHNALVAMRAAASGVYCGPLRLLAMEVYDTCNAGGTLCNLVTGQERREVPGAAHTACTVEMVSMSRRVDVAVIDEIQMIGDEQRGWAWTRALMGAPANEVHLCGDGSAVELVRRICEEMGEPFEVRTYERFTTLSVEEQGLPQGYREGAIQPGDCVVAFSRRDIYAIKQLIEQESKALKACVVYGGLPPETRRQQARLFNDPENDYGVLVASDAVGMGLNLNIRRIVFHAMHKYEGGGKAAARRRVSTSMVKQIAGRAGRRSSQFRHGLVTCANPADVPLLKAALEVPLEQLTTPRGGLFPEFEHLEVFAGQRPDEPFRSLLRAFEQEALLDSSYFFCRQDSVLQAAALLDRVPLGLKDMYSFCTAPASATDPRLGAALLQFAARYSRGMPVTLGVAVPRRLPANVEELKHLEAAHQVVMLWLWLSYRFDEEAFPERPKVEALAAQLCALLDRGLSRLTRISKRGRDISGEPAGREHERILECFSDEVALLEAERKRERAAATAAAARARKEAAAAAAFVERMAQADNDSKWHRGGGQAGQQQDDGGGTGSRQRWRAAAAELAAAVAGS